MTTRHILALATSIAALATASAQAATVTWGAATNISGDLDVSTAGTLVAAHNLYRIDGGNLTANLAPLNPFDTTINGVTFTGFGIEAGIGSATLGSITFSGVGASGINTVGSSLAPFSNLSASYQTLLGSMGYGSTQFTLTLGGLTVGQTYQFQWWTNSSHGSVANTTTANGGGSTRLLDSNTSNTAGGTGQFAIGTFVADNAAQAITFTGNGSPSMNGFQLRQLSALPPGTAVPEPGSALVGLMVLGLCGARLGRRRA